uniref:Uncharacterized protein n=1 Tax=Gorilla gorilla gorilla TaxID=9595 RepID=A0A2I2ZJF3_GORGO
MTLGASVLPCDWQHRLCSQDSGGSPYPTDCGTTVAGTRTQVGVLTLQTVAGLRMANSGEPSHPVDRVTVAAVHSGPGGGGVSARRTRAGVFALSTTALLQQCTRTRPGAG